MTWQIVVGIVVSAACFGGLIYWGLYDCGKAAAQLLCDDGRESEEGL